MKNRNPVQKRDFKEACEIYRGCRQSLPDNASRHMFSFFEGSKWRRGKGCWFRVALRDDECNGWRLQVNDNDNKVRLFAKNGKEQIWLQYDLFRSM